ncbi:surfactin synthetase [Oleiphilus messinensis]|uniref:Surfactin synthetase n=1 Tax=Oleiphilus messinensis TaxID=141451 RepID=A0A1Y0I3R2_9GAMM|nr:AMP-binding protein [Oleiphilus messinensis]ARU55117.1 surfactin synthetase [Oleiphilus messinensis]
MINLNSLLKQPTLFFGSSTCVSGKDWAVRLALLTEYFENRNETDWLLFHPDTGWFASYFFALLCAGKRVVLPQNDLPEYIADLRDCYEQAITPDTIDKPGLALPHINLGDIPRVLDTQALLDLLARRLNNIHTGKLLMFTSGSSGKPKAISKRMHQLENEVQVLQKKWPLQNSSILSTVSHQHIYGLLFRLLWPLSLGRPISRETLIYPETLAQHLSTESRVTLVSSPAFLSRLVSDNVLQPYHENLQQLFSSGGPLHYEHAKILSDQLHQYPIEVYGSTETGGIAWRQQTDVNQQVWHRFPAIEIKQQPVNNRLSIRSPFIGPDWYDTDDEISSLTTTTFQLRGRLDRIVKIEEKRINLAELENQLEKLSWVSACRIVALPQKENSTRTILGAAVTLSNNGHAILEQKGRRSLIRTLKAELTRYFEAVTIPRKWRFLTALKTNAQGKYIDSDIIPLFALKEVAAKDSQNLTPKDTQCSTNKVKTP